MTPAFISTFLFFLFLVLSSCYAADFDSGHDSFDDVLAGSAKFTGVSESVSENWKGNTIHSLYFYIQSTVSGSNLYCQVQKPLPADDGEDGH